MEKDKVFNQKWVHVVGVAGVTTSAVALMFKDLGWQVTGSDKAFFPPASTFLEKGGIKILPGYKPERLTQGTKHPDLVIYNGVLSDTNNPEVVEAKRLGLSIWVYTDVLENYVVKKDASIVVTGTYGKTTITAALIHILQTAKVDISYMLGGFTKDLNRGIAPLSENTRWSVVEGDEYLKSLSEVRSKFFYYHPTHLIINAVEWDHTDMFKTEAEYLQNFAKLVETIPEFGLIVANARQQNVRSILQKARARVVYYSVGDDAQQIEDVNWFLLKDTRPLPCFVRKSGSNEPEIIPFEKKIIGDFNDENLLAASVMAYEIGIKKERIQEAIETFSGIQRRLEKRWEDEQVCIIDDFASSPGKLVGSLKALRKEYPDARIVSIFEPNSGNRTNQSLPLYNGVFAQSDEIVLPRFTKLPNTDSDRFGAETLAAYLQQQGHTVHLIQHDQELLAALLKEIQQSQIKVVVAFMGAHGFRGMIEQLVNHFQNK